MIINISYESSANSAPAGFKTAIAAAAQYLGSLYSDPITVNIQVGYGDNNGMPVPFGATVGFSGGMGLTYAQLRADLVAHATSADDQTALASLPMSDPSGASTYFVSPTQEKVWGLLSANDPGIDGTVGFQVDGANGISSVPPVTSDPVPSMM